MVSWDEAWGIKKQAVARGMSRRTQDPIPPLDVDEKAIAKQHHYLTMVAELERNHVFYLAEDRPQASLNGFWTMLPPHSEVEVK